MKKGQYWLMFLISTSLGALVYIGYQLDWVGLKQTVKDETIVPAKNVWDWLNLLIVPLVIALGGFILNKKMKETEIEISTNERKLDREIANERFAENSLQIYFDRISELLTKMNLREEHVDSDVVRIARARTLSLLNVLDGRRKGSVVQFLSETHLLEGREVDGKYKYPPILLGYANLKFMIIKNSTISNAHLHYVDMSHADLSGTCFDGVILQEAIVKNANLTNTSFENANCENADFKGTDFTGSNLKNTNFRSSDLTGVCFKHANLDGARLYGAKGLKVEQLSQAESLRETRLSEDLKNQLAATSTTCSFIIL